MNGVLGLLLFQAVLNVPAYSPPGALPPVDSARLSLVVATTVSETDPQPLCDRPNCTSLFLGRYQDARVLAGTMTGSAFSARVQMGSPWNRPYRLALIVEERPGGEALVRALTGFSLRTGQACFERSETDPLGWTPEGPGVTVANGEICVRE
jgi:hypothetical protein